MARQTPSFEKYYDKDYASNGIHRVPLWRIALFGFNNTSTNTYMFLMNYASYYLLGFVGVGLVIASSFLSIMRVWDGVTDPIIGALLDKTNGRFGKNRPFMIIGNALLCICSFILFHVTHLLPENVGIRFVFFIVIAMLYYIGYTCQCMVTKSAQSALTNDPKQRPMFAAFDGVYTTVLGAATGIIAPRIANAFADYGGYSSAQFFHTYWLISAILSAVFCALAVFAIAPKDRTEFYGTGEATQNVGLKDYWDVLKNNRAMQMLVLSASTDKLGTSAKTSAVQVALFGCIAGSTLLQSNVTLTVTIPATLLTFVMISVVATRVGQRKSMIIGSIGGIILNTSMICLWVFGDPTTMTSDPETGAIHWGYFMILFFLIYVVTAGFQGLSGSIAVPMTADVADYEVYRSGRYVPGMIGTLFSFVDKLVSSLGILIAGVVFAMCGYDHNPVMGDPVTSALRFWVPFVAFGLVACGQVCNLVAMYFYPLTKEKMASIQNEIAAIKAKSASLQQR